MINGIIFDMGGTLLEFRGNQDAVEKQGAENVADWYITKKRIKVNASALAEAILAHRQTMMRESEKTLVQFKMSDAIAAALKSTGAQERAISLATEAAKRFFEFEESAHVPVIDVVETLKALKSTNKKIGLLSNASDDGLVQRLINRAGLRPWLSPVFSSAGVGRQKPDPEPFLLIARRWRLPPDEIAVVGDSLNSDIRGAHNAGMKGVLVTRIANSENAKNQHIKPDAVISTLAELPRIIAEM